MAEGLGERTGARVPRALTRALYALFALAYGYTLINVCIFSPHYQYHTAVLLPLTLACAGAVALALRALRGRMAFFARRDTCMALAVTLAFFLLRASLVPLLEYTPVDDIECAFQGARAWLVNGSFTVVGAYETYFMRYANTLGLLTFLYGVLRVGAFFGVGEAGQFLLCGVVNSALVAISGLLLWALMRRAVSRKAAMLGLLFFTLLPPTLFCGAVFYSDTVSMPFVIGTLYLSYRAREQAHAGRRTVYLLLMGVCAAVGALVKTTALIALIAALIDWLLCERPRRFLCALGIGAVSAALVTGAFSQWIYTCHLDREAAEREQMPLTYWILTGIPTEFADGEHTDWLCAYITDLPPEQREAETVRRIAAQAEEATRQGLWPQYISRKNDNTFGDGTFTLSQFLSLHPKRHTIFSEFVLEAGAYYPLYRHVCMALYACVLLFACVEGLRRLLARDPSARRDTHACAIALVGAFVFLMCWESKGRYFFNFLPVLCAVAGAGAQWTGDAIRGGRGV